MAYVGKKCPVSGNKIIHRLYQVINKVWKIAGFGHKWGKVSGSGPHTNTFSGSTSPLPQEKPW